MEMTPEEKRIKIAAIKAQKNALQFKATYAYQKLDTLRQAYYKAEEEYVEVKKLYESLDREEKLLFFSLKENRTPAKKKHSKKPSTTIIDKAKKDALASLNKLPKAIREQIIANFK